MQKTNQQHLHTSSIFARSQRQRKTSLNGTLSRSASTADLKAELIRQATRVPSEQSFCVLVPCSVSGTLLCFRETFFRTCRTWWTFLRKVCISHAPQKISCMMWNNHMNVTPSFRTGRTIVLFGRHFPCRHLRHQNTVNQLDSATCCF